MSLEGSHGSDGRRGADSGDPEPPPPSAPRPPPPASPECAAGPVRPPGEVAPRRRGADERPPPPPPLAGPEAAAAGDSGEGPRGSPETAAPEAAGKGGPGKPEAAAAGGEGERRGAGDQPETRSVCSSRSSSSGGGGERRAGHQHQHHQPICKICFQGAEQGELLNPCRCDGSVRYTHQLCLLKWISERGSWTCELCCYRYHVIAIKMKQPCQWQSISITLVEKVQMIAVILGSLFLIASVTWLLWSAFSPYAVWQRKDILFQICYGMYGFMDLVCIGLIVHEGAAVYRVFKRWRAVNLHWDVLNYDKATDIEESSREESSTSRTLWLPLTALRNRNSVHPMQLTSPRFQCGYVLLHLFNRMRPHEDLSEDSSSGEVVMRVTSV
ncbi:E3 ubiquitin-protein ligase MARCHF11 [Dipodomys spectabilis]|uniref:E3 ubiquitin-protein ligase MARCHF11 n=1 Tax=Dipodomys spectabilis TaxID=105255 RepID=UPI001C548074|nr:E3 ubiquitin-protein ligase MARCHF11 [Dipodomys spectabilis]